MTRLIIALGLLFAVGSPALAQEQPILGTMPAYPGATRPLPRWETAHLAIAMTPDKPEAVVAYYMNRLPRVGWRSAPGTDAEAAAAVMAKEPVWMTFLQPGIGRLDIEVTQGRHPKTGQDVTLIMYQADLKPRL